MKGVAALAPVLALSPVLAPALASALKFASGFSPALAPALSLVPPPNPIWFQKAGLMSDVLSVKYVDNNGGCLSKE